jgi:hypothetical protein
MIIAMVAISALVLAACIFIAAVRLRRQRTPAELRGNWWGDFERQFRAYAAEATRHRRTRRTDEQARRPPTSGQQVDE